MLTEEHRIESTITDENRKIKLGEKVHSLNSVMVYKLFKSSSSLDIRLVEYEDLAIFYTQMDLTVEYLTYDATYDKYSFNITLFRNDTLESQNRSVDITGGLGDNNIIQLSSIWGTFDVLIGNFIANSRVVISIIAYESSVLVIDSFNPFVGSGATNHIFFNIPANSVYLNELPLPQSSGDIYLLVKYLGLGSVITAESLNDIVNVVKYYNLMPKFDVTKVNNNDIKLYIRGEYYYLDNYVEKFDDATYQIEDEILLGQWNALIGFLDTPNHIFNITRVSVAETYNNLLADLTNFINENPDYEIPIFILVFDTNKDLFEYAYINRGTFSSGGSSGVNFYNITFTSVLAVSFNLLSDRKPLVQIYDNNGYEVLPDTKRAVGTSVNITFYEAQSGVIACAN